MRHPLLLGTLMLLVGCDGSYLDASLPERPSSAKAFDGWHIKVSVRPSVVPPLVISAGAPRPIACVGLRCGFQHELVLENRGGRPLRFADTRASAFIGAPGTRRLIAADEGCGYVPQTGVSPLEVGACQLYLDAFVIKPRARVSRTITLIKGLPGMRPLTPGTYTFERVIRFRVGQEIPDAGEGRSVVVRIDYRLLQRQTE